MNSIDITKYGDMRSYRLFLMHHADFVAFKLDATTLLLLNEGMLVHRRKDLYEVTSYGKAEADKIYHELVKRWST